MAQGSGTRPWKRGTEAARALATAILPDGDLLVTDEGNVYAGTAGRAISALKRLVRADEPGVGQSIDSASYAFAIRDPQGRVAFGVAPDATVIAPLLSLAEGSVSQSKLSSSLQSLLATPMVDTRYSLAFRDPSGRIALAVGVDGSVVAPLLSLTDGSIASSKLDAATRLGLGRALNDPRYVAGITDGNRYSELVVDATGSIPAWSSRRIVGRGQLWAGIACWGDSITEMGVDDGTDWPTMLALDLGVAVYNGGWQGQNAQQIAARQGGAKAQLAFPTDTIPASGAATVTVSAGANPVGGNVVAGRTRAGFISTPDGPVSGTLGTDGTTLTWTRTTPGSDVSLGGAATWTPADGAQRREMVEIYWVGRNNVSDTSGIVAAVTSMAAYQTAGPRRFLVLSVLPWDGQASEVATNKALAATFPEAYVPVAAWLRTTAAATAVGITFTGDDNSDIAAGLTPRSFRNSGDGVHLNNTGRRAVAYRIKQELITRGWI